MHDVEATVEYAERLSAEAETHKAELCVAMRVYFEKPRTTTGWKGLINDPHLDGSFDVNAGLRMARRLLLDILSLGLPVGCEFLDPITPQYIADTVCWGAIGARTTESQIHRQLGSGLSMPVGFKNRTDGDVQVAVDAVRAAAVSHAFAGIDENGASAILYTARQRGLPHHPARWQGCAQLPGRAGARGRRADARGGSCRARDDRRQPRQQRQGPRPPAGGRRRGGEPDRRRRAARSSGVMIESFLLGGRQDLGNPSELTYGQSITDGCIDWNTTVEVLENLSRAVRERRAGASA